MCLIEQREFRFTVSLGDINEPPWRDSEKILFFLSRKFMGAQFHREEIR